MRPPKPNPFLEWQLLWGSPKRLFFGDGRGMETSLLLALIVHTFLFGYFWQHQQKKLETQAIMLQNVDFMEPEPDRPPPPPVEVQKPKSAMDFLKMALPVFNKPPPIAAPKEVEALKPKAIEPKLAEPDKLVEKKLIQQMAPELKLDAKNAPELAAADLSKITLTRSAPKLAQAPALNLEEVGRKAVALPPQTPSISMDRSQTAAQAKDISMIPKQSLVAGNQSAPQLVEKSFLSKPSGIDSRPLGYERRGGNPSLNMQAREVVRTPQAAVTAVVKKEQPKQEAAQIKISKEKVKITGPLSARKVLKYVIPEYPEWAKARGIEADVSIRFTVNAIGDVETSVVETTSGYPQLDRLALDALKLWKYSPLPGQDSQWGVITFRFLMD
jgi:protein TonB